MTINERVSDERLSVIFQLSEAEPNEAFVLQAGEAFAMARELQQYRAAAKKPIYQVRDWNWYDAEKHVYDEAVARGDECRVLYAAPQVTSVPEIGEIRVGRLPTMNQDEYPGLGDWWVQLRIGEDYDEVLARVYGATPQEANNRAEALACRAAMLAAPVVQKEQEVKK
ncbi:hypothetical protein [Atlantibacter hermannii]|uniref:hypothetical protein n=1 Tax=Atlantibacter hermannii TaxID=565 RepID=UPI0022B7AB2C|nr:hypothetical protein [Atlantibacter hermannii]MCZ7836071.1 hypothetical protein [Atlantibacter hermannii]